MKCGCLLFEHGCHFSCVIIKTGGSQILQDFVSHNVLQNNIEAYELIE